jgi:large-conductance mechanosensitive channel
MSTDSAENIDPVSPSSGRKKQKIRIKYRERVRIKKRPEGNKFTRYWKKNRKNIITSFVLLTLLGFTIFMMVKVVNQKINLNYKHKEDKSLGF